MRIMPTRPGNQPGCKLKEGPRATKPSIAGLYNRVAGQYDRVGPQTFAVFGRLLVEEACLQAGMRVLDVATGRGAILIPAGGALNGQGQVAGIDLAWQMVHHTRLELAQTHPQLPSALLCMDGEQLGFASAAFDVLLCGFAYFFLDPRQALPEWQRVLRPGGLVAISVAERVDPRWAWYEEQLLAFHEQHDLPLYSGSRSGRGRIHPTDIAADLRMQKFSRVRVKIHDVDITYPDAETWWQAKWTHGARYPLEHMPPDLLAAFQREVISRASQMELSERWRLACILARR